MEDVKLLLRWYHENGNAIGSEMISLWHGHKPFLFVDDSKIKYVSIANRLFFTQEEYNAFFYGITHARSVLLGVLN